MHRFTKINEGKRRLSTRRKFKKKLVTTNQHTCKPFFDTILESNTLLSTLVEYYNSLDVANIRILRY
jgi:hypothetical protein